MITPVFDPHAALFIIWRRPLSGSPESIAAGSFKAMDAVWTAVKDDHPADELTFQHAARILRSRPAGHQG